MLESHTVMAGIPLWWFCCTCKFSGSLWRYWEWEFLHMSHVAPEDYLSNNPKVSNNLLFTYHILGNFPQSTPRLTRIGFAIQTMHIILVYQADFVCLARISFARTGHLFCKSKFTALVDTFCGSFLLPEILGQLSAEGAR